MTWDRTPHRDIRLDIRLSRTLIPIPIVKSPDGHPVPPLAGGLWESRIPYLGIPDTSVTISAAERPIDPKRCAKRPIGIHMGGALLGLLESQDSLLSL